MATKEITKSEPRYADPEIERHLIAVRDDSDRRERIGVARLRLLWENRRLLNRNAAIAFVVATIIAFLIPSRYTTTSRLMPPDQAGQGLASMVAALGKASDLGALGSELLGVKTSGDLFVGVLRSETVQDAVINKFDLRKVYGEKRYVDARKMLESRTEVNADRKSGIITIKVTDNKPDRAAAIGREYVEQLNRVVITLDTSSAHRERVFLENRLNEVKKDLEQAEKDFSQFASKNATLDVREQGKAMIGAAGELEGEMIAAQTQLEGLRQIYTPENVRVRSLQARIDEYKRQLQKLGGKLPAEGEVAPTPNAQSGNQNGDIYPSIRELPIVGVTWTDLYRRTRVQEAVFETLTKQYEMARVEEAREVPSIKVLDLANVPEKKSFPPRLVIMILGAFVAWLFSALWVLAHSRWEQIDPNDPGKKLALEIYQSMARNTTSVRARMSQLRRRGDNSTAEM